MIMQQLPLLLVPHDESNVEDDDKNDGYGWSFPFKYGWVNDGSTLQSSPEHLVNINTLVIFAPPSPLHQPMEPQLLGCHDHLLGADVGYSNGEC